MNVIEEYINASKNMTSSSGGTNKKCYLFDNVVLLEEDTRGAKKIFQAKGKIDILKSKDVNVCRILETTIINDKLYELQEKASGKEMFENYGDSSLEGQQEFLKTLDSLSKKDESFYKKFLSDWANILESGFIIDPSKNGNFFYDGEKITFIDLDFVEDEKKEKISNAREHMLIHAAIILRGGGLPWYYKNFFAEANEKVKIIYQKLGKAAIELGENVESYISYLDSDGNYGLREYFDSFQGSPLSM